MIFKREKLAKIRFSQFFQELTMTQGQRFFNLWFSNHKGGNLANICFFSNFFSELKFIKH